jgi:hypothetical protein
MLQLFSTNMYGFRPTQVNPGRSCRDSICVTDGITRSFSKIEWLPHIIEYGRTWYTQKEVKKTGRAPLKRGVSSYGATSNVNKPPPYRRHDDNLSIASDPSTASSSSEESDVNAPHSGYGKESDHQSQFDLAFLRWSCLFDAIMTAALTFSSKSWQMYIGEFVTSRVAA